MKPFTEAMNSSVNKTMKITIDIEETMGAGSSFIQDLLQYLLQNVISFSQEACNHECSKKENGESLHACKVPVVLILVIPIPEQSHLVKICKSQPCGKGQQLFSKTSEAKNRIQEIEKIVKETLAEFFHQRTSHYSSFLPPACSHQKNSNEKPEEEV